MVRREWHISMAESLGPQKADVPDTVGADERLAALGLLRAGLEGGAGCAFALWRGPGGNRDGPGFRRRTRREWSDRA